MSEKLQVGYRASPEMREKLAQYAQTVGMSRNDVITLALIRLFEGKRPTEDAAPDQKTA